MLCLEKILVIKNGIRFIGFPSDVVFSISILLSDVLSITAYNYMSLAENSLNVNMSCAKTTNGIYRKLEQINFCREED